MYKPATYLFTQAGDFSDAWSSPEFMLEVVHSHSAAVVTDSKWFSLAEVQEILGSRALPPSTDEPEFEEAALPVLAKS